MYKYIFIYFSKTQWVHYNAKHIKNFPCNYLLVQFITKQHVLNYSQITGQVANSYETKTEYQLQKRKRKK